ncbi:MAG: choice-of-anchor D domain-containing protein [Deltaproteobacteria bacterium]|nr:choice-of-anchor D domain-containing protein [Deltaproteobacteria bacterium]
MNSSLKYEKQKNKKALITSLLAFCLMMVSSLGFASIPQLFPGNILFFGSTPINSQKNKVILVQNTGNSKATITNVTIDVFDDDKDNFFIDSLGCLNIELQPDEVCLFQVQFNPDEEKVFDLNILFTGFEGNQDNFFQINYTLSGIGTGTTELSVNPEGLFFGNVITGSQSPSKQILVQNTGAIDVEIQAIDVNNLTDFTVIADTCSTTTLQPDMVCFIEIAFNPQMDGFKGGTLSFITNPNIQAGAFFEGTGVPGGKILLVTPNPVNFGEVGVGNTSAPQNISATNTGDETVNIGQVTDNDMNQRYERIADNCSGQALLVGQTCTITYTYSADQEVALDSINVTIPNDAGDVNVVLNASGVVNPAISFSPLQVNFGPVAVGESSESTIISVTSVGSTPLAIDNVQLINGTHFTIVQDNCNAKVLIPGASCLIVVKGNPQAAGNFNDSIKLTTNTNIDPSVPLAVEGVLRELTIAPGAPFDFGVVNAGETSADQVFTVTNTGGAPINVFAISLIGSDVENFNLIAEDCSGKVLAVAGECNITVNYQPNAAGSHVAQIQVAANTSESPVSHEIRGTGVGIGGAVLELDPSALDFDRLNVGQIQSQQITVTNIGNEATAIDAVSIAGNDPSAFSQENSCSGLTLASGESCVIVVTFNSNAEGNFNAVVVVESADANSVEAQLFGSTLLVDVEGGCSLNTQAQSSLGMGFALLLTLGLARRLRKN